MFAQPLNLPLPFFHKLAVDCVLKSDSNVVVVFDDDASDHVNNKNDKALFSNITNCLTNIEVILAKTSLDVP